MKYLLDTRRTDLSAVVQEPVDLWPNVSDVNYNTNFFFSLLMNTMARLYVNTRHRLWSTCIFERSILSAFHVFTQNALDHDNLSVFEFSILKQQFTLLNNLLPKPDAIIYLRSLPDKIIQRIEHSSKHLYSIHKLYDQWLLNSHIDIPVYVIDADQSMLSVQADCDDILATISYKPFSSCFR